jgi:hypothetical protein
MATYTYSPLDSGESQIRLLTIPPRFQSFMGRQMTGPLTGSISHHYLPMSDQSRRGRFVRVVQLPVYTALSYVWGDAARSHEILIDKKRLPITANLHNALRDIWQASGGMETRVWADAICINQDDPSERSAQIALMREIYQTSFHVQIWLGKSTPETFRCHRFIALLTGDYPPEEPAQGADEVPLFGEQVAKALFTPTYGACRITLSFGQSLLLTGDLIRSDRDRKEKVFLVPDEDRSLHCETINKLAEWRPTEKRLEKVQHEGDFKEIARLINKAFILDRDWFERMWVVQELTTSQNAYMQFGGYETDWDSFMQIVHYLQYVRKIPMDNLWKVTGLEKIRMGWNEGKPQPLRDLLRECRYRRATDPRDKIYALLGIMGDPMNYFLEPDYSKPVKEVFANAALHFITQTTSLDPICGQQVSNRRQYLPSWVPDFTLGQDLAPAPLVPIDGDRNLYAASGYDHRSRLSDHDLAALATSWSRLRTSGLCIGTISHLSAQ